MLAPLLHFQHFSSNASVITMRASEPLMPHLGGAAPYKRDLPEVETHLLDTGHFALETHCDEIADHIETFLGKHLGVLKAAG